jgi:hypothetical protein
MEILEKECLDRLNKILSKFDLKIEFFHIKSNAWYRLVDNSLSKNTYSNWLGLWIICELQNEEEDGIKD